MIKRIFAMLAGFALISGCAQDDGPRRYHVQGQVTYEGRTLHSGRITFVPDSDRGNSGPPGYALIKESVYDTQAPGGKASVAGPLKVLITGFAPPSGENEEPKPPIFDNYALSAEINPKERLSKFDFDIPKVKAAKKQ